jgi:hypothetical protein
MRAKGPTLQLMGWSAASTQPEAEHKRPTDEVSMKLHTIGTFVIAEVAMTTHNEAPVQESPGSTAQRRLTRFKRPDPSHRRT